MPNEIENEPAGFEIALVAADVKNSYKHAIVNGATAVKEPLLKPWGLYTMSYILGYKI